jgi:hypothetical protein
MFSALHGAVDDAVTQESRVNRSRLGSRLERLFLQVLGIAPA